MRSTGSLNCTNSRRLTTKLSLALCKCSLPWTPASLAWHFVSKAGLKASLLISWFSANSVKPLDWHETSRRVPLYWQLRDHSLQIDAPIEMRKDFRTLSSLRSLSSSIPNSSCLLKFDLDEHRNRYLQCDQIGHALVCRSARACLMLQLSCINDQ